jgi:hypothetical protein
VKKENAIQRNLDPIHGVCHTTQSAPVTIVMNGKVSKLLACIKRIKLSKPQNSHIITLMKHS